MANSSGSRGGADIERLRRVVLTPLRDFRDDTRARLQVCNLRLLAVPADLREIVQFDVDIAFGCLDGQDVARYFGGGSHHVVEAGMRERRWCNGDDGRCEPERGFPNDDDVAWSVYRNLLLLKTSLLPLLPSAQSGFWGSASAFPVSPHR